MSPPSGDPVSEFIAEVWNGRRLELLDRIAASDYRVRNLADGSMPVQDRLSLRRHIQEWIEAFPDLEMIEADRVSTPARVAAVIRVTGTHTGARFAGIEAAGRRVDIAMVAIFDTDGRRLLAHSTLVDVRRLLDQLKPATCDAPSPGRPPTGTG
jgi:predicted ester cyclase